MPRRAADRLPDTPQDLYESLTVTDPAIGALWRHQSHVLERYYEEHRNSADVALELPTGAGKTLVGLLIADWRRRTTGAPSVFVCPTRQLARQAHEKAAGYGIPTVLLIGPSRDWDPVEETAGLTGGATIVSVYAHVFNASPKINGETLVLDDAHAAEGPVAENWSVQIERDHDAYQPLLEVIAGSLPAEIVTELRNEGLSPHSLPPVQMVGPKGLADHGAEILAALDANVDDAENAAYALSQVRSRLSGCVMYVGWREILIRPVIPPTRFHEAYEDAAQRVYMSATLGKGGELERSFGRTAISRIAIPPDWERRGSGRRLVLVPRAGMQPEESLAFIQRTVARFARALVLVPSQWEADEAEVLLPDGWEVMGIRDVDERLHPFQESTYRALVLANRYDGIDLPGEQCELILVGGLPTGTHLQERFLFATVGAKSALRERIRTRLMQGMGRATRSRTDRAVVLMAGEALVDFLREPANLTGLRPELQAELSYGMYLAREGEDLDAVVDAFVGKSEGWEGAEQYLREEAERAGVDPPDGMAQLEESAPDEVLACEAAWRGDPWEACLRAQAVVRRLTLGSVGPYRTVWKVLAAHWAAQHATATRDAVDVRIAHELARDAQAAARALTWRPALPDVEIPDDAAELDGRSVRLAGLLQRMAGSRRVDRHVQQLEEWISSDSATEFELGIERMGSMLGFDAVRPNTQASPDGAWRDAGDQILWEAKSEQHGNGPLSAEVVRQAGTHPTWVQRELDWQAAEDAIVLVASPRETVDASARAVVPDNVYLVSIEAVRELATATADLWRSLIGAVKGLALSDSAQRIARELAARGLQTGELKDRLAARQIAEIPPDQ